MCFNKTLLNFNQQFAADSDYIFFNRSAYEHDHLRSSKKLRMHKIKSFKLKAGTISNSFEGTVVRFVARDNVFSFSSSVKETTAFWKQLQILTYFLTSLCGLICQELP